MAGLGSALETAKNTLLTQQTLIQTTSHNIANADNATYARQTATIVTTTPSRVSGGWVGNGTTIAQISQYRDAYVDKQVMTSVSQEADYQTRSSVLGPVASFLQDDGNSGLSQTLGAFWDAWDTLSQNPTGTIEKQNVVSAAGNLANGIKSSYDQLSAQGGQLKTQIAAAAGDGGNTVGTVNTLLQRIAGLDQQISTAETGGQAANDLRDTRYQAVKELSGYVGVSYSEAANGTFSVTVTDSVGDHTLVSGAQYGQLRAQNTEIGNTADPVIQYRAVGGGGFTDLDTLNGGSLNGMLTTWGTAFSTNTTPAGFPDSYMNELNTFAGKLIGAVNAAHGAQQVFSGSDASDISVDPTFTSGTVDSTKALDVASLQNNTSQHFVDPSDDRTFGQYLANIQQQMGLDVQDASSQEDFQKTLLSQLEGQQQSVSGVNLDEEMVNLIKFQQVYQAAAKVVTATRDMMNSLMDMI